MRWYLCVCECEVFADVVGTLHWLSVGLRRLGFPDSSDRIVNCLNSNMHTRQHHRQNGYIFPCCQTGGMGFRVRFYTQKNHISPFIPQKCLQKYAHWK